MASEMAAKPAKRMLLSWKPPKLSSAAPSGAPRTGRRAGASLGASLGAKALITGSLVLSKE